MLQEREMWVDNIKIFACVLVTLGHFFQSMTQAAIIPVSAVTQWFNATVYYFHVPLFFLCSGYVHQRFNRVTSFSKWKRNLLKKAVTLGIPYFGFSLVTWGLKYVFSGAVNTPNEGLLETLFVTPGSPYWFLYILFILFAITPALNSKGMAIAVAVTAVVCKGISIWGGEIPVYAVSKTVEFGVWFVAGMVLAMADIKWLAGRKGSVAGGIMAMAFLAISTVSYAGQSNMLSFAMGILGCVATVLVMYGGFGKNKPHPVWERMARYTMPVFLMHTIFAAGWRSVLMKIGVTNAVIHIVTGVVISFIGPVIVAEIAERVKILDIFLNPGRYIQFRGNK